jgi:ketosteroid isomerase-like protein
MDLNRKTLFILLAACVAFAGCASTGAAGDDPGSIVPQFIAAFNDLDANALSVLFMEDATAFMPAPMDPERVEGRAAIVKTLEPLFVSEKTRQGGSPPYLHLEARELVVQRTSSNSAVITFDVGNEIVHSRRTLVVERSGGRWKIAHLHASNVRGETD